MRLIPMTFCAISIIFPAIFLGEVTARVIDKLFQWKQPRSFFYTIFLGVVIVISPALVWVISLWGNLIVFLGEVLWTQVSLPSSQYIYLTSTRTALTEIRHFVVFGGIPSVVYFAFGFKRIVDLSRKYFIDRPVINDSRALMGATASAVICFVGIVVGISMRVDDPYPLPLGDLAISPDGHHLVSMSEGGIQRWDISDNRLSLKWTLPTMKYGGEIATVFAPVNVLPEGSIVRRQTDTLGVEFRSLSNGAVVKSVPLELPPGKKGEVRSFAFSPNGVYVAAIVDRELIALWQISDGKLLTTFRNSAYWQDNLVFSPTSNLLAVSGISHIEIWEVPHGTLKFELKERANSLAWSSDGQELASGGDYYNPTVTLWNLASQKAIRTFFGHTGTIYSLAISPDGEFLASGSGQIGDTHNNGATDLTIRLWRISDGQQIRTFEGAYFVNELLFTPEGRVLISQSWVENIIRTWKVP